MTFVSAGRLAPVWLSNDVIIITHAVVWLAGDSPGGDSRLGLSIQSFLGEGPI
jgi:hypothetical protein